MLRKLTLLILVLIPFVLSAQLATGSWKNYLAFGKTDRIIETPQFVYVATAGALHSYDKVNDESRAYYPGTDLSGDCVKDIYYNFDKGYLVVVYEDGNMDVIPDDGERISLPDIRDANVSKTKTINDVKFDDGLIYVATTFGLVIYDDTNFEVKESGMYPDELLVVDLTGDNIIIIAWPGEWTYNIYCAPKNGRHNNIEKFTRIGSVPYQPADMVRTGVDAENKQYHFTIRSTSKRIYHLTISDVTRRVDITTTDITDATSLSAADDGAWFLRPNALYHVSPPSGMTVAASLPEPLQGNAIATLSGTESLWAADEKGLGHYSLSPEGTLTVLRDKYRPADATTFSDVAMLSPLSDNRGFLLSNRGLRKNKAGGADEGYTTIFTGNRYENGTFTDIPANNGFTIDATASKDFCSNLGDHAFCPTFILEDPDDHSITYVGSGNEGVYIIKDGKQIGKFNSANSPIPYMGNWAYRVCSGQIDQKGNLLIGIYTNDLTKSPLAILPADKRRKDPTTVTREDWVTLDFGNNIKERDLTFHLCRKLPIIFLFDSQYRHGITALYYGNSITDPSDDSHVQLSVLYDQDGKTFTPDYITCFAEDSRGRVWVGTTSGVVEISSPANAFSSDFRINRLKVPRNDGTNLADYLLETETIYAIAVDAADRKWIGTAESGLYLVSPNGDEILANFNTTNSPLATNCISDIFVDPNSNSVFIATLSGLYEYSSSASPAKPDYSDVIAYPNPVTPDYTGLITIRGLMESSLIKIMDAGMHLVYQTKSDAGMATWDGCDLNGSRVRSGIYYVLASTSDDTSSQGDVVAKILVVN